MQYYYLVAGLTEYPFDTGIATTAAGTQGGGKFNVREIRNQIKKQLTAKDQKAVELLYLYYDIVNVLNYIKGSNLPFSVLGNMSGEAVARLVDGRPSEEEANEEKEQLLEAEMMMFPSALRALVDRFKKRYDEEADEDDKEAKEEMTESQLEVDLYDLFYREFEQKKGVPEYLRRWGETDRMIRNITAAYKARAMKWPAEAIDEMIIGSKELRKQLVGNQNPDFGLKGEWPFVDDLMGVLETTDFVERERKMDALRWDVAEGLKEEMMDYFGIGTLLTYLIHLNILHRWVALDPDYGKESFRKMVESLTRSEIKSETEAATAAGAGQQDA